ncbi:MAG: hypothetical protein U5L96_05710 [Owenweeksia sp.]|nr:hypothetical protein [Owenweeksia sp.]
MPARHFKSIENVQYLEDSISNGTKTFSINMPSGNVQEVRITLYWPDKPASTIASRALVNDLDMNVTQGSNTYDPWVLDPTSTEL